MTGHLCAGVVASLRCGEISVSRRHTLFDITNTMEHQGRLIRDAQAALSGPSAAGSERGHPAARQRTADPAHPEVANPPQLVLTSDGSVVGIPNLRADRRALLSGLTASLSRPPLAPVGNNEDRSWSPASDKPRETHSRLSPSTPSGGRALPAARPNK